MLLAISLSTLSAFSQGFVVEWVANKPQDGTSCVSTCGCHGARAVSTGTLNVESAGDRNLYVCRSFVPGMPQYGARAGYNWNGSIGSTVQAGCEVAGANGTASTQFDCLCQKGH